MNNRESGRATMLPRKADGSPSTGFRVLVADDEPLVRRFLKEYLETQGHTVNLAVNGEEVWGMVQSETFDCCLLDIHMPGMGGGGLNRLIGNFDDRLASKVIFITADPTTADPCPVDCHRKPCAAQAL